MKTYSESRIKLPNLQFLKKLLDKSSQFLSSEKLREPKSLDVALILQELKQYAQKTCDCGQSGAIRVGLEGKVMCLF